MNSIISHRGTYDSENTSLESIKNCVEKDIGIEIDLRLNKDTVYVSHDPCEPSLFFEDICSYLTNTNVQIALHIKELDAIAPSLKTLKKKNVSNFFLFTSENHKIQQKEDFQIAYYANIMPHDVSDQIIWCDESIKKWFNTETISELKNKNNQLIAISQEILTNCLLDAAQSYWKFLFELGFDGICTNFAEDCKSFIMGMGERI